MAGQSGVIIPIDIMILKPIAIMTYRTTGDRRISKKKKKNFLGKKLKSFDNIPQNVSQPVMMLCASVFKIRTKISLFVIAATGIFFFILGKKNGFLRVSISFIKIILHDVELEEILSICN